jgi:hypothetical protein
MSDLNDLVDTSGAGWLLESAFAINDVGQIAVRAIDSQGATHAVLLSEAAPVANAVSEPNGIGIFGFATFALGFACRRRRIALRRSLES